MKKVAGDRPDPHLCDPGKTVHKLEQVQQDIPRWGKGLLTKMTMINDNDDD